MWIHVHCTCTCTVGLLHVRVTGENGSPQLTKRFHHSWAAFNQSARAIDWVALTTSETTYSHIRLHQLKKDDSLSYFWATLSSIPAAHAIILVNTDNTLRLPEKRVREGGGRGGGGGGEQCPPVPVLVVTRETGAELLALVREHPRCVEVKVELSAGATASTHSSWAEVAGTMYMYIVHVHVLYMYIHIQCTCICKCTCKQRTLHVLCMHAHHKSRLCASVQTKLCVV